MADRNEPSCSTADKLTAGNLLAKNTILNLLGQGLPLLVALFAIPLLIKHLGTERFGVLTLIWVITGYFSLFDLGLGRALTQLVADRLGQEKPQEIPALVWTALALMLVLGILAMGLVLPAVAWLTREVLHIPEFLQAESRISLYLIAVCLPVIISTPSFRGLMEAQQRFDVTAVMSIVLGVYTFLSPLLVLSFSTQLVPLVAVLLLGRVAAWGVYVALSLKMMPALRQRVTLQPRLVKPLLSFGGWMTLSNLIGPIMVYFDRFIIGGMISMAAVAYYTTPYEVIAKLLLVPIAMVGVLFPAFSMSFVHDRSRTEGLFHRGVKYIFLGLFPLCLVINTFAADGLHLWLGSAFAQNSTRVVQWLTAGMLINGLAFVPFALLQGMGRPDLPAKLHLCELPLYLAVLGLLITSWGIEGAAVAWVLRALGDTIMLFYLACRLLPEMRPSFKGMVVLLGYGLVVLGLAGFLTSFGPRLIFFLANMAVFLGAAWFFILEPEERKTCAGYGKFFHPSA